jgi:uncharacterized protein (DUF2267 family)
MDYEEFIDKVAARAGIDDREKAAQLTHATLQTLAERITGGEARDLAEQLPRGLKGPLRKGEEPAESFDLREFERRVAERADLAKWQAPLGIRAVFETLHDAVSGGEWDDLVAQLPSEYRQVVAA